MSLSITVMTREGSEHVIRADPGSSMMEIIRNHGLDEIEASCGGECSCATCHIYIESGPLGAVPKISEMEDELLTGSAHRKPESRLACQIPFDTALNGIRVQIAPADQE